MERSEIWREEKAGQKKRVCKKRARALLQAEVSNEQLCLVERHRKEISTWLK